MSTAFVALYRGDSISTARLVAVSTDQHAVQQFIHALTETADGEAERPEERSEPLRVVPGGEE